MNGEWCFFKSYLSKEKCRDIIELAKDIPEQDAKVGVNDSSRLSDSRRSKIKFIEQYHYSHEFLFDILWKTARQDNNDFFNYGKKNKFQEKIRPALKCLKARKK